MKVQFVFVRLLAIVVLIGTIHSGRASSVTFGAESGVLGTGFIDGTDGVVQFASIPRPQGIQWFLSGDCSWKNRTTGKNPACGKSWWLEAGNGFH